MNIKLPSFKRSPEKENALARARLAAAFYDIAVRRGGLAVSDRNKNHSKRRTQRYIDIGKFERKTAEPR
ncbi:MAG: hypothetical protein J7559_02905 [Cohnella sp.]|nr:hypothetical protein [Cohnella sp.]